MAKRVEALVTPEVLIWARKRARLSPDEAAKKIGRPVEDIEAWETGEDKPTISQARNAEKAYKVPLATFYLSEPPKGFSVQKLHDFRTLPSSRKGQYSFILTLMLEEIQYHQEWLREHLISERNDPLSFVGSVGLDSPPEKVAKAILETLDITPQEQMECKNKYEALKLWILNAESAGVNVFRRRDKDVPLDEGRGFVLSDEYAPFVFINSDDSDPGQLFTLVHELAHLWINVSGITNLKGYKGLDRDSKKIEQFCNKVASFALMESSTFDELWKSQPSSRKIEQKINNISGKLRVSDEAVARRLLDKGIIDNGEYKRLRALYNQRWSEAKERKKARLKESDGGPDHNRLTVIRNGTSFTKTVLSAYYKDKITGGEASSLLGNKKIDQFLKVAEFAGLKVPADKP